MRHSDNTFWLQQLQMLFQTSEGSYELLWILETLASVDMLDEQWISVLDQFGRLKFFSTTSARQLAGWLAQMFNAHPDRLGLLRLLSLTMDQREQLHVLPALVDPDLYNDPQFREAAIMLRIAIGFAQPEEVVRLAQYTVEIAVRSANWLSALLTRTKQYRITDPFNEVFLLELLQGVPSDQLKQRELIISDLNDALRRRTSRLHEHETWRRLGLPNQLNAI